jgi:hypothetical protein
LLCSTRVEITRFWVHTPCDLVLVAHVVAVDIVEIYTITTSMLCWILTARRDTFGGSWVVIARIWVHTPWITALRRDNRDEKQDVRSQHDPWMKREWMSARGSAGGVWDAYFGSLAFMASSCSEKPSSYQ